MNYPQGGNSWQQMPPPNMTPQPYPGQPYAPGYYAPPPPPKKKKTWLWILLAVLAVVVLAVGGVVGFTLYVNRTMTYEVTGTGATATVVYSETRDSGERAEVPLPWTKTFTGTHSVFNLQALPLNDDTVTCKVTIGGRVIATDTQRYRWASCMGHMSDR